MVKKSSIFSRLAERLRTGSGVRVDEGEQAGERAAPGRASVQRFDGSERGASGARGADLPADRFAGEARTTRKLSEREEAMVALGGHFQELSSLLRGVHTRLDDKLGRMAESAESLRQLPVISGQQLDLLRAIAGQVERQQQTGERIAQALEGLPAMMKTVDGALQRAAQSDERSASTLREFQGTMDRIQTAMGRMVDQSAQQAQATKDLASTRDESLRTVTDGLQQAQQQAVQELRSAADQSLQSLRRTHEDQSNRLQRIVQEHAGWNKAVLAVLGVVALGMFALLVMQLVQ